MERMADWIASGGLVMPALAAVGLVLAFLATELLLWTRQRRRRLDLAGPPSVAELHDLRVAGVRRMGVIRACVLVAPLLGLLGTVVGVTETFEQIVRGGYVTEMSRGISQALLTTQYGLCIAVPGLLVERLLRRRLDALETAARAARERKGAES